MDLCIKPTEGGQFTIEIGYFDTVLEIKETVQKYQGISVSKQVLIFNGQVLPDDLNVHFSQILDQSSVQLLTENDSQNVTKNSVCPYDVVPELKTYFRRRWKSKPDTDDSWISEEEFCQLVPTILKEFLHELQCSEKSSFNTGRVNAEREFKTYFRRRGKQNKTHN